MIWINILIISFIIVSVYSSMRYGFIRITWNLIGLVLAFFLAVNFYDNISGLFSGANSQNEALARPISFLAIWFIVQLLFFFTGKLVDKYTPDNIRTSKWNHYGGILPAVVYAVLITIFLLLMVLLLPINEKISSNILNASVSEYLLNITNGLKEKVDAAFYAKPIILQNENVKDEQMQLGFTTNVMRVDEIAEDEMVGLINEERVGAGLKPLKVDTAIHEVARNYSKERLQGGFFSHVSPSGQTLFDRLKAGNVVFSLSGENIALSPAVGIAHVSLMESPKHRENIMNPNFGRVGVGIMDAGSYGLMITENFAN